MSRVEHIGRATLYLGLSGMCGITASMWTHQRFIQRKRA